MASRMPSKIANMTVIDLERNFCFFKVMGVSSVHAHCAKGINHMCYNLTVLLFPHLLPIEKVDLPNSHARKIAHHIKEQKEEKERIAKQKEEQGKRALRRG